MGLKAKLYLLIEHAENGAKDALLSYVFALFWRWRKWVRVRFAERALVAFKEDSMSLEKTLVDKTEEKVKLALVDGKIQIVSSYEGKIGGVDLTTYVKTDAMIDFLTGLIPGTWDEVPAAILKEKLKSL